jgi:nicotinamide riboside kinase
MAENLHKVSINNKSYGELNGVVVYLTDDLYKRLEKSTSRQGTLLDAFKMGRALQGQKHIISLIKESRQSSKIVFNLKKTERVDNKYFINYDEYRRKSRARFFPLYRQTGLDAARFYLSSYLPKEFEYTPDQLKESEIKKVNKQFPRVLSELSVKDKNKVAIIEEATKTIRRLKHRTRALKEALADLQRQSNLSFYQQSLDELKTRLTKNYPEVKGTDSWQRWIYRNHWLFGVQYLTPIERERVGFDNIPDFLFPTLDGFIDILEIKRPNFDTIREDPEHSGSYMWCPETNKAIGQVVNYIQHMELHQLELAQQINDKYGEKYPIPIQSIKPRAFILIGNSADWRRRRKDAFRTLNYSLHGIEVLTYTDLIKRGESIISMLSKKED